MQASWAQPAHAAPGYGGWWCRRKPAVARSVSSAARSTPRPPSGTGSDPDRLVDRLRSAVQAVVGPITSTRAAVSASRPTAATSASGCSPWLASISVAPPSSARRASVASPAARTPCGNATASRRSHRGRAGQRQRLILRLRARARGGRLAPIEGQLTTQRLTVAAVGVHAAHPPLDSSAARGRTTRGHTRPRRCLPSARSAPRPRRPGW